VLDPAMSVSDVTFEPSIAAVLSISIQKANPREWMNFRSGIQDRNKIKNEGSPKNGKPHSTA
jgi:hypothetical protein